jgi:hypothetical protein
MEKRRSPDDVFTPLATDWVLGMMKGMRLE